MLAGVSKKGLKQKSELEAELQQVRGLLHREQNQRQAMEKQLDEAKRQLDERTQQLDEKTELEAEPLQVRRLLHSEQNLNEETEGGTSPAAQRTSPAAPGTIILSHELELDGYAPYVTVCSDTSGFRSDSSGRVVPANSAGAGSAALPQPCLIATIRDKDHLTVLSVDGSVRLRIHCEDIEWDEEFDGLHCDRQLLYLLQESALTVSDLSGRKIRRILPDTVGFIEFGGICSNATTVFLSSIRDNKIAAFSKTTGLLESLITLQQTPDADLRSMVWHDGCIMVADITHNKVLRVRVDSQQVVAAHPTPSTGLTQFGYPSGVAVDSRGRVFVSEWSDHSVRAVAANDGSLLWTLGEPGEEGDDGGRLNWPHSLAVVTGGPCEQLVVSDVNFRLLVLNLH